MSEEIVTEKFTDNQINDLCIALCEFFADSGAGPGLACMALERVLARFKEEMGEVTIERIQANREEMN